MLPWLALERFGAELYEQREKKLPEASSVRIVDGRPLVLPARVTDVTEGFVAYAVDARAVAAMLNEWRVPLAPVDLGTGQTAACLFGASYRVSDLGSYDEVGLAFLVAPRRTPLAAGLYYFELAANTRFSCEAAKAIWGVVKNEERVDVSLGDRRVAWRLVRKVTGHHVFTIAFPRGGAGASTDIPLSIYTMIDGSVHRARSRRTGRGERIRFGLGDVSLTLGDSDANAHDPLWNALRRLGLPRARAIAHGWTERMSGKLAAPHPVSGARRGPRASRS